jgi:hypothetical protein
VEALPDGRLALPQDVLCLHTSLKLVDERLQRVAARVYRFVALRQITDETGQLRLTIVLLSKLRLE